MEIRGETEKKLIQWLYSSVMEDEPVDQGKRNFLKAMIVVSAGAAVIGTLNGVIRNIITPAAGLTSFPVLTLVDEVTGQPIHTSDIKVNSTKAYIYYYPLDNDPNFLIRLGDISGNDVRVSPFNVNIPATGGTFRSPGGVGPYGSVVSFSAICQHLGCVPPIIHYYKGGLSIPGHPELPLIETGYIHCNCHGSTYDPLEGAKVVTGPTVKPLPNTILDFDPTTDTYRVRSMIGPTIYGKPNDLQGGTPFPSGTKTTPVTTLDVSGA